MMFPSFLHIPSIAGAIIGGILAISFWGSNKPLAIILGVVCMILGVWLGMKLSDKFYKDTR